MRDSKPEGLKAGTHPGDRPMMIAALNINRAPKATRPFGLVISDIWHKVGKGAIGLSHHAVLVIAPSRRAQPQRPIRVVGMTGPHQRVHHTRHPSLGVERTLQVVAIESDAKRLQIQILLVAQAGHRESPDCIQIVHIATGHHGSDISRRHRISSQETLRNLGNVFPAVTVFGEGLRIGRDAPGTRLNGER